VADGDLARLTVVPTEQEAELVRGLLATAGIPALIRVTDFAAGAWDAATTGVGPREVLVRASDLDAARELLAGE
jgi:hypothetical protein